MTKFNIFRPSTLGFENMIKEFEKTFDQLEGKTVSTYPPHNIIKTDVNKYSVELALAGFNKNDIEVSVEANSLIVKGSHIEPDSTIEYLHRGIATRTFTKTIKIADTIEVEGAEFVDGVLRISLVNVIPENKKAKKIDIKYVNEKRATQLLTE